MLLALSLLLSWKPMCREGKTKWEDLELDDIDLRLKWSGLFHRRKRAPGTFMMRLKVLLFASCAFWLLPVALSTYQIVFSC